MSVPWHLLRPDRLPKYVVPCYQAAVPSRRQTRSSAGKSKSTREATFLPGRGDGVKESEQFGWNNVVVRSDGRSQANRRAKSHRERINANFFANLGSRRRERNPMTTVWPAVAG